jgi:hypothetical protein
MDSQSELMLIDRKKLLGRLVAFEICLVAIFAVEMLLGRPSATFHMLFNLDGEGTIPAWFSTVQLFSIGLVFLFQRRRFDVAERRMRNCLLVLGAGFLFLSADEAASIHEKVTVVLKRIPWAPRFNENHGIWIFVYAALAACVLAAIGRGLFAIWKNDRPAASTMAGGLGVMVLGGVGAEIFGYQLPPGTWLRPVESCVEEFCEMAGASVILYGALTLSPQNWTASNIATDE